MSDAQVLTFWRPRDDEATLCEECGTKEMNTALAVQLGLVPEFTSMQDVVDRFSELDDAGPDYFIKSEHGTCKECGAAA